MLQTKVTYIHSESGSDAAVSNGISPSCICMNRTDTVPKVSLYTINEQKYNKNRENFVSFTLCGCRFWRRIDGSDELKASCVNRHLAVDPDGSSSAHWRSPQRLCLQKPSGSIRAECFLKVLHVFCLQTKRFEEFVQTSAVDDEYLRIQMRSCQHEDKTERDRNG